jgi:hypothetical protein
MGAQHSFEDFVLRTEDDLAQLRAIGDELTAAIARAADAMTVPSAEAMGRLQERCDTLAARQAAVHADLAAAVEKIAAAIEAESALFDSWAAPSRIDRLIGRISTRAMRRRIERRQLRAGGEGRLQTALGRADRLAGLIEVQRGRVAAQRAVAEEALARLFANTTAEEGRAADMPSPDAATIDHAVMPFNGIVDRLSRSAQDYTILIHKLMFDIESLLDLHHLLIDMHGGHPERPLAPEAYPYFAQSVRRHVEGLLPGARVKALRQIADLAFRRQFADG